MRNLIKIYFDGWNEGYAKAKMNEIADLVYNDESFYAGGNDPLVVINFDVDEDEE